MMTLLLTSSSSLDWVICTAHKSLLLPSDDDDQNCFLFCCAQHFQTFRIPSMVPASTATVTAISDVVSTALKIGGFGLCYSHSSLRRRPFRKWKTRMRNGTPVPAPLPQRLLYLALPVGLPKPEGNSNRLPATTAASWTEFPIRILALNTLMQDPW